MPTHPLPNSCSRLTPLFQGEWFALDDWRCAGEDTPAGREEWSADDRVVVTRRGAWELAVEGEARLADPVSATLWNRGAYRVRHPVGGGDRCTVFRLTATGAHALRELAPPTGIRRPHRTFTTRARPSTAGATSCIAARSPPRLVRTPRPIRWRSRSPPWPSSA